MAVGVQLAVPQDKTIKFRVLSEIKKKAGEFVEPGDILFTYEDAGEIREVASPAGGAVLEYFWEAGAEIPFYQNVCCIGEPDEEIEAMRPQQQTDGEEDAGDADADDDESDDAPEPEPVYVDPIEKIKSQVELITRKNMIVMVSDHILQKCEDDFEFYSQVNNPKKSLENCIKYINNRAKKRAEEIVKLGGNAPGGAQVVAIDGDEVYTWAVEYFGAVNLPEDGYKPPAKPKAPGGKKKKGKAAPANKADPPKEDPAPEETPLQLSLM